MAVSAGATRVLDEDGLEALIAGLRERGYTVIAPTVHNGAIEYAPVTSAAQLPRGVGDEQSPGRYRLREREDAAHFGFATAPVFVEAVPLSTDHDALESSTR